MKQLLDLQHVTVDFQSKTGPLTAIRDVSLQIKSGETVCLVGESGSGKTITSKAIMRLIDYEHGRITEGGIFLDGVNLAKLSQHELRGLRGKKMAMIFQEPMAAFDPLFTIGSQITEAILEHQRVKQDVAWKQAIHLLERVGIPEPELRMRQYPNELSGGMLQRAMIAMALACGPELLIADEPTTALDVTIQSQILQLLQELKAEYQMSILLITHDMGIAAEMADRIIVMYAGRVVEQATSERLFELPHHPYTRGLLHSITTMDSQRGSRLFSIEGSIPHLAEMPSGCRFHPRCPFATQKCLVDEPPLFEIHGRQTACWYAEQLVESEDWTGKAAVENQVTVMEPSHNEANSILQHELLFDVKGLSKSYPVGKSLLYRSSSLIRAVDDVSFTIKKGETFGLVGESGSGKSTLGRVLLQLEKASQGSIRFQGLELTQLKTSDLQKVRRDMQVIFQDPYGSINPRWQIGDVIGEPLMVHEALDATARRERVEALLEAVGLNRSWYERYPHEFSGGQRQRIGIARAIALNPSFVLADEAVSALDVSVQAQIVNLMQDLQRDLGLTYLFIAHGLNIVRHISDRIGVMYLGKLVEIAASEELFLHPAHHYTKGLIASIPVPDPKRKREPFSLQGEIPSPANPPSGCRFHTRCPAATARCKEEVPAWQEIQSGHWVACHHPA